MPERTWKLKRLDMEVADDAAAGPSGGRAGGRGAAQDLDAVERDRQRFLEELEEDPEMRQRINLYKVRSGRARCGRRGPARHVAGRRH